MRQNTIVNLILPEIRELLHEGSSEEVAETLASLHAADIADLIQELEEGQGLQILRTLDTDARTLVFEQLDAEHQVHFFEELPTDEKVGLVADMDSDDRADLIHDLPPEVVTGVLRELPPEEAQDLATLVTYGEETAGGIMTTEYVRLRADMTVQEAIERAREQATSKETIYALFVLDTEDLLIGVVSLQQLVLARPPETRVGEIMYDNPISVSVDTDQETVMQQLQHYDFLAMPVLDEQGHMVGIVTHDDALDVAIDEATEDVVRMGGAEPLEAPYFATGLLTLVRKRVIWLTILFFAGLLAGTILRVFEAVLEKEMALIYFLPLIIAAGGNSGSQSATLVIRGLATGDLRLRDWWSIGRRELSSGLLLGLLLGLLGATVSIMWGKGAISPTVFATLVSIVMFGSLLGSLLPLGLARLGIDPAITSSPLVACLVDLLGIVLYVGAAEALL